MLASAEDEKLSNVMLLLNLLKPSGFFTYHQV